MAQCDADDWYSGYTVDLRQGSTLTFKMHWNKWLPPGAQIASQTTTGQSGITVVFSETNGSAVTFQVSGITAGQSKTVTVAITTDEDEPQIDSRAIVFRGIAFAS